MKTTIRVADRKEAELIREGLEDPTVRALVKVMGALRQLPTDQARRRTLAYVADLLSEESQSNS